MNYFENSTITTRQQNVAKALDPILKTSDVILFFAGDLVQKPGGHDQNYPYLPHPEYYWLSGSRRPSGVLVYSKNSGWNNYVKPVSRDETVWEGTVPDIAGHDVATLEKWLQAQNFNRIFTLGLPNLKQQSWSKGTTTSETHNHVQKAVDSVRRRKDAGDLHYIRLCATFAAKGYAHVQKFIQPGVSEREIQIAFETVVLQAGAEKFPYETLIGAGNHASTIHAVPGTRRLAKDELLLIDGGADLNDYCVDITRVYPANGKFYPQHQSLYDIVLAAELAGIKKCQVGVEWLDVHQESARVMAEGLKGLGILKGEVDSLLETGAIAVFFPHGVGHMVGLKIRDVGGSNYTTPRLCCGVKLRVDLKMEENFFMTVEPGCYFIPPLIDAPEIRSKFKEQINWDEVGKWVHVGGIRIEDNILFTASGPENLTAMIAK